MKQKYREEHFTAEGTEYDEKTIDPELGGIIDMLPDQYGYESEGEEY